MAIELLGNAMTVQAQSVQPTTKPIQTTEKVAEEYVDDTVTKSMKADVHVGIVSDVAGKEEQNKSRRDGEQQATNDQIKKAVEKMNRNMSHSEAVFGIHDGTNRVTIKIIDKETKEVIKELPPEKTLDMIAKVWEMAGLLVDEKR